MYDINTQRLVKNKMLSIFKPFYRRSVVSSTTLSQDVIIGETEAVVDRLATKKYIYHVLCPKEVDP